MKISRLFVCIMYCSCQICQLSFRNHNRRSYRTQQFHLIIRQRALRDQLWKFKKKKKLFCFISAAFLRCYTCLEFVFELVCFINAWADQVLAKPPCNIRSTLTALFLLTLYKTLYGFVHNAGNNNKKAEVQGTLQIHSSARYIYIASVI